MNTLSTQKNWYPVIAALAVSVLAVVIVLTLLFPARIADPESLRARMSENVSST